jgi:hypothetical protein
MQEAMKKMKELQARDAVRKRLQAQKKKEMAEINAMVRAEAERRQADALATWLGFLQKRKDDYAAKCEVCFLFLTLLPEVCVFVFLSLLSLAPSPSRQHLRPYKFQGIQLNHVGVVAIRILEFMLSDGLTQSCKAQSY